MQFIHFIIGSLRLVTRGTRGYYVWVAFLLLCIAAGVHGYIDQLQHGMVRTNMRDPVSWGFYIGNFTFLVGVAAAAVVLVIPAYVYQWKPIKEIVIIGELLAVSAIIMCVLFVFVDLGRPDHVWHLIPFIGKLNVPNSILAWDVMVLNAYGLLNFVIVTHILYRAFMGREYSKRFATPLILLSIPLAVSIHSVTAFVYNGMPARPFWNSAILAPRFIASAFCSGPAMILVLLQILRHYAKLEIKNEAIWKIAELMAYAMFINLFLLGAEIFRDYYSGTHHLLHAKYLYSGLHGSKVLVPYAWASVACSVVSFLLFLVPATRRNPLTLNVGAFLIYCGVYIEKGMALVIPGFTPSVLGEIYEYTPSRTELEVAAGIFGVGFLVFTLMLRIAVPIMRGEFHLQSPEGQLRPRRATAEQKPAATA
ncbi:MAG: polysulfide reductase NrfD [Deltaproteobacteria bacterium]|nr:polysulfide reductase NrfD [Deltaproteobacteria bacterium]